MFVFWSIVGALLLLPLHNQEVWGQGKIMWENIRTALGITWEYGWNVPLWFLRVLMVLALLAPLLHRLSNRILVTFIIGMLAAGEVFCIESVEAGGDAGDRVPHRLYESFYAWGFFAAGILFKRIWGIAGISEYLRKCGWLIILFAVLLFPSVRLWGLLPPCQSGMLVVLGVGTILSIGCLVEQYAPRLCCCVAAWGSATFFIYVTHYIIISYVKLLWEQFFEWNVTGSLFVPVITLLLSCVLFILLRRLFPRFTCWMSMLKPVRK